MNETSKHLPRVIACLGLVLLWCSSPEAGASEDVRALVTKSLHSWQTLDEKQFIDTAHADLVFAFPGTRTDAAGALEVFRYWAKHYADTKVYMNWVLVDGSRFAAEFQFATTRKSDGKRSAASTVAIGEVRDGKIILFKEYTDGRVSRMQVKDELPLDEGQEPYPWPRVPNTFPPKPEMKP